MQINSADLQMKDATSADNHMPAVDFCLDKGRCLGRSAADRHIGDRLKRAAHSGRLQSLRCGYRPPRR
jgi:hypothetical protein